jgi:hypothetical protein
MTTRKTDACYSRHIRWKKLKLCARESRFKGTSAARLNHEQCFNAYCSLGRMKTIGTQHQLKRKYGTFYKIEFITEEDRHQDVQR